jgi:hypothetical protein
MIEHLAAALSGRADMAGLQVLESCSSTWIFDEASHRFRRVPRGAPVSLAVPARWAEYHRIDLDESRSSFTVELDPHGTRLLRASLHHDPCPRCQSAGRPTESPSGPKAGPVGRRSSEPTPGGEQRNDPDGEVPAR